MSGARGVFVVASLCAMPEDLLQVSVLCQKICCKSVCYARRFVASLCAMPEDLCKFGAVPEDMSTQISRAGKGLDREKRKEGATHRK